MRYLWQGNLRGRCDHDAFILEAFQGAKIDGIQGSFLASHRARHSPYYQKLLEAGISARKICLVRDPSQRLYSHVRHKGRSTYHKRDLLDECIKTMTNLMDRYIYDYDLYDDQKQTPYCKPTDYENCDSVDFFDFSDDTSISSVKCLS